MILVVTYSLNYIRTKGIANGFTMNAFEKKEKKSRTVLLDQIPHLRVFTFFDQSISKRSVHQKTENRHTPWRIREYNMKKILSRM